MDDTGNDQAECAWCWAMYGERQHREQPDQDHAPEQADCQWCWITYGHREHRGYREHPSVPMSEWPGPFTIHPGPMGTDSERIQAAVDMYQPVLRFPSGSLFGG